MYWVIFVVFAICCVLLGGAVQTWLIGRDPAVVVVKSDEVIIKKDILAKLVEQAKVSTKNPRIKFDARGFVSGVQDEDGSDEGDEEPQS